MFVHGALCMCYSGQCYLSAVIGQRSGNRGLCAQPCRLPYNGGYPLSLKDLMLAGHVAELADWGVSSLKIEGRMKRPEYAAIVTKVYSDLLREHRRPTAEERDILQVVSDALSGELHVSRRATIAADIVSVCEDGTKDVVRTFALNDMALTRGPLSDMVEFDITVSGHHIDRLRGDGVVVSTATGSTGYALSAGGPIVSPDYTGMVCVPIAPHTIQARAFLTSPSDVVEIFMSDDRPSGPAIAIDGQFITCDGTVESVAARRGPGDVLLLDYGPESFYNSVSRVFYGVRHDR